MKAELKAALIGTETGDEKLFAELARMTAEELETLLLEVFQK